MEHYAEYNEFWSAVYADYDFYLERWLCVLHRYLSILDSEETR